jgi:hypothetical protein
LTRRAISLAFASHARSYDDDDDLEAEPYREQRASLLFDDDDPGE